MLDGAANVVFAVATAVGVIGLTRLSTSVLDPVALGVFLSARRYSASASALVNLGGPLFQIRYLGMNRDKPMLGRLITIFTTGVFCVVSLLLTCALAVTSARVGRWLLPGDGSLTWFPWIVLALCIEQLFHFVVQNHLLVQRRMVAYNAYKFAAATGLLCLALAVSPVRSARSVLVSYVLMSLVPLMVGHLFVTLHPLIRGRLPWNQLRWLAGEAATYGPPRALVNFMDSVLFVLPVWLLRHDVAESGYVLTMLVFVQATGIVILPVNELVMVVAAEHVGAKDGRRVAAAASVLLRVLLVVSCALVAGVVPFREALYRMSIGNPQIVGGVRAYSLMLPCIIPMTVFGGLKGLIEVTWRAPLNLANLLISQGVAITVFYMARRVGWTERSSLIAACSAGYWLLGFGAVVCVRSFLPRSNVSRLPAAAITVAAGALVQAAAAAALRTLGVGWFLQFGVMLALVGASVISAVRVAEPEIWNAGVSLVRRSACRVR